MESVDQECMEIEFNLQQIAFLAQESLKLQYKGHELRHTYQPDFTCFDKIIVEIKALEKLADEHRGQLLNYLPATGSLRIRSAKA